LHDDEIILSHQSMDRGRRVVEVMLESLEGLSKPLAALRPCRVLNQVLGDVTESRVVSKVQRLVKG
jgi:hypothetical protein